MSFSISKRDDHKTSYASVLTYLVLVLAYGWLGLSLVSRSALTALVGEHYGQAYLMVAPVALAYVCPRLRGIEHYLQRVAFQGGRSVMERLFS